MEILKNIIAALPYGPGFCFVDEITSVDEDSIQGSVTFRSDLPFYKDHFIGKPMVPGVIMIEAMGQIGMVCHMIFLAQRYEGGFMPVLSNVEADFFSSPDYDEKCTIIGRKIYFRKNILKSQVELFRNDGTLVAQLTANLMLKDQHE
jgi:3-hydroxyacyl-[acyl-carrier-protein] dehydratase